VRNSGRNERHFIAKREKGLGFVKRFPGFALMSF
jgi:hypothetical protein